MSGEHRLTERLPLFAVLRGLEPERAVDVAETLVSCGFQILEVTMNSPDPIRSIATIAEHFGDRALVGAGTVTSAEQVAAIEAAGGKLIVSPHCDPTLIDFASSRGLAVLPGVLTPSEMFQALAAGAAGLKIFPAELFPPYGVRAVRAVLPGATPIYVVGGIHAGNMPDYLAAGATGFGLGSSLFRPGKALDAIASDARAIVQAYHDAIAATDRP